MTNPILIKNFDLKKIPPNFFDGITKLFYELGIDGKEFLNDFVNAYFEYASNMSGNKTDIYLATGFGRRGLEKHLKGIVNKQINIQKENHKSLIDQLKKIAKKHPKGLIPIYGKFSSFVDAFHNTTYHTPEITAKSMIKKLIRVGFIEKYDKKNIRFISSIPKKGMNDVDDIIRILADTMNTLCTTLTHNLRAINNEEALAQMSISSDLILSKNFKACSNDLREITRNYYQECIKTLLHYEEKGEFQKKQAESQEIKIGASAFVFITKK